MPTTGVKNNFSNSLLRKAPPTNDRFECLSAYLFFAADVLDIQIEIDSIIGTVNWSVYARSIVRNENIEPDELANQLTVHLLRGLGYASVIPEPSFQ
jgi:hypothetical protein